MDGYVGVFPDNYLYRQQEIIVHLLLTEVHPALGIEAARRGKARVGVGDEPAEALTRAVLGKAFTGKI